MKAINIKASGDPSVLHLDDLELPYPQNGEVLIRTTAAGLNHADLLQRQGLYPPPEGASPLLGLEVSGIIEQTRSDLWKKGDKVCALLSGGGYAEYCIAQADHCLPVPANINIADAAALPEAIYTVWQNIFVIAKLQKDETILIHGGSSGIGTMAIQMAKMAGASVIVTAGTREKCEACLNLGADYAIHYKEQDFAAEIKDITSGKGVNVVLDMVGGEYTNKNIKCLARGGRIVNIAFLGGRSAEIDMARLIVKNASLHGSTLRSQPNDVKASYTQAILKNIWPHVQNGDITPVIDSRFSLQEAAKAHKHMESGVHIGKILLEIAQDT